MQLEVSETIDPVECFCVPSCRAQAGFRQDPSLTDEMDLTPSSVDSVAALLVRHQTSDAWGWGTHACCTLSLIHI